MNTGRVSFLVSGWFFALLAAATLYICAEQLVPAVQHARIYHLPGIEATRDNIRASKLLLVVPFYAALSVLILRRRYRTFVIIGATVSLFFVGLGTVAGAVFLLWTLRYWPREGAVVGATV